MVQYSILLIGSIAGSFTPSRGLRQGDPLSPYLFILCTEFLSRMLMEEEEKGGINGIKVSRRAPTISHLLYADDILVMCRANKKEASVVKSCFDKFCLWSGHEVSLEKSSIMFSRGTSKKDRVDIKGVLGFKDLARDSVYLGNSLIFGRNKAKEFHGFKERVNQKLEGWSRQLLSKAGKATLIKSVIQAAPIYTMSTFQVPVGVCNELDTMVRRFWWNAMQRIFLL